MLTLKELAKKLDVVPDTIRNYTKMGLPFQYDEKGRYRFDEEEAKKWHFNFKKGGVVNGKKVNGNGIVTLPPDVWALYDFLERTHFAFSVNDIGEMTGVNRREFRRMKHILNTSPLPIKTIGSDKNGVKVLRTEEEYDKYIHKLEKVISSFAKELAVVRRRKRLNGQLRLTWTPDERETVETLPFNLGGE
jgi:hypothetical protein